MFATEQAFTTALLDPAAYPHPCSSVDLIETHISSVFLTGLRAYKVKKPVDFGFVNFESLESRRRCCEEELRLNRRLAPELYIGVVPIVGTPEAPRVGGDGEPFEYAVEMRQFDQHQLMSSLSPDALKKSYADQLASLCADFHERAAVAPADSDFGSTESIIDPVRENFFVLTECLRDASQLRLVEEVSEWSEFEFERIRAVLVRRRAQGRVRECHGDMHLGNMFLHDGQVVVFDGIEFNESLRWIDVASEIAFIAMDLDDRGRNDLAMRFVNRWLELTGDYEALSVLRFYEAYRAAVRAKVLAIRLSQGDVDTDEAAKLTRECWKYLELAYSYTRRDRPSLMITMGPSGSGKTTTTQDIVESMGTIRIRSDVERKRLFGLSPETRPPDERKAELYSPQSTKRTYQRLEEQARIVVDAGFPVVVDATFLRRNERNRFAALASRLGASFLILTFEAHPDVLRERIRLRNAVHHDASDADDSVLDDQLKDIEPLCPTREEVVAVDGTTSKLTESLRRRQRP